MSKNTQPIFFKSCQILQTFCLISLFPSVKLLLSCLNFSVSQTCGIMFKLYNREIFIHLKTFHSIVLHYRTKTVNQKCQMPIYLYERTLCNTVTKTKNMLETQFYSTIKDRFLTYKLQK